MCQEENELSVLINRARKMGDALRPVSEYQILEKDYAHRCCIILIKRWLYFQHCKEFQFKTRFIGNISVIDVGILRAN
jgi:hypothetical protein